MVRGSKISDVWDHRKRKGENWVKTFIHIKSDCVYSNRNLHQRRMTSNLIFQDAIIGLIRIKSDPYDIDTFESVINIYKKYNLQICDRSKRIQYFRANKIPGQNPNFAPGTQVILKNTGKIGVVVAVKNGGWRKVFLDGKYCCHRPGELQIHQDMIR